MASDAENAPSEWPTRLGMIAVSLAEMGAIAAKLDRERSIVIQQKRNIPRSGDGHQGFRGARNVIIVCVLEAQLQTSDIPGIERRREGIAKDQWVKPLRGDEIEPTGLFRHDEGPGCEVRRHKSRKKIFWQGSGDN